MKTPFLKLIFIITAGCLFPSLCFSAIVTGKITDSKGESLPFVNVYVKATTRGTTANINGIYSLDLSSGNYELSFKMIGYKTHTENMSVSTEKISLDIKLEEETYTLKSVVIDAGAEDPAYAVIRNAIKKRKFYKEQVEEYSCDVYIKGSQTITKYPKKVFGFKVDFEGSLDTATGIIYLSESVSKFNFKKRDKIREEMISSKVSGNNKAFSYNRASDMLFNFYENTLDVAQLSKRGFISPIAADAMLYYKYRLEGSFFENGEMVNKIEVIPKRKSDPVFRGYIYIIENSWRIQSTELYLTKDANISFVDTLMIKQVHLPVDKNTWMVFSDKLSFRLSFMGFEGDGVFLGVHSNYNLAPGFPEKFFTGEVMKVNDDANKKDSAYWKDTRPVPLTDLEKTDYHRRDSARVVHESKPYLDSLDRKNNKPKLGKIFLTGYSIEKRFRKTRFEFSPLVKDLQYNTVQGLVVGTEINFRKGSDENKNLRVNSAVQYGFSNERWYGNAGLSYLYNPQKFIRFGASGGHEATQFNGNKPISPLINTIYTLADERNWMKIYEKTYGKVYYNTELTNGLTANAAVEFSERRPLFNTSDFVLFPSVKNGRVFISNNPEFPKTDSTPSFAQHQALDAEVQLRWRPGQKYYTRPNQKIILGSRFPQFVLLYKKAILGVMGSDADYDFASLTVRDNITIRRLGTAFYSISAGKFFTDKNLPFMDYHHFNGNQTLWSSFVATNFNILDYYKSSTGGQYAEGHYVHNFGGILLSRLPLLKKAKLNEVAGFHLIASDTLPLYYELSIGLEKLSLFRVDFVAGFAENKQINTGVRFGIQFN